MSRRRNALVLERDRHLKWRALDPVEHVLMILCGLTLAGFSTTVFLDVVTRSLGHPWLWLQEVTMTFFVYGIFAGAAAATRGDDRADAARRRNVQPPRRARCGAVHGLVRLPQFPRRVRQFPDAVDDAARL